MAVSSPPSIPATSNPGGAGGSAGLFRPDPLYAPSPSESPRLAGGGSCSGSGGGSLLHGFISNAAPAGGGGLLGVAAGGGGGGVGGAAAAAAAAGVSGASAPSGPLVGNECKMVDLHGVKVASFVVDGQELICLPQVFDLFLKHLVGGLHTVYTKLKRLDIAPVVCTVEQVRILRGLGAIQPGVNRCKLITRKDFETLYSDCTNASSRPGRPPKRSLGVAVQENTRLLPHGVPGLLSPGLISPTGLTAMAEAMKLQKIKLMAMNSLHGSGSQNGTESENEELNSNAGGSESSWDKEKLQSPIPTGSHHGISHAALSGQANLASAHPLSPLQQNHLLTNNQYYEKSHLKDKGQVDCANTSKAERIQDSPSPAPSVEESQRPGSHASSHQSSSVSSSPSQIDNTPDRIGLLSNIREGEPIDQESGTNPKKLLKEKEEVQIAIPILK
ncbi:dachshund homolog 2, partial [Notechis scutatus]|uniref:Dachshund homolog 2 n=1 Tax=Notechis scutatus TaxID=8663 RepID=A0A6J1URV1_9SAUR